MQQKALFVVPREVAGSRGKSRESRGKSRESRGKVAGKSRESRGKAAGKPGNSLGKFFGPQAQFFGQSLSVLNTEISSAREVLVNTVLTNPCSSSPPVGF